MLLNLRIKNSLLFFPILFCLKIGNPFVSIITRTEITKNKGDKSNIAKNENKMSNNLDYVNEKIKALIIARRTASEKMQKLINFDLTFLYDIKYKLLKQQAKTK